MIVPVAPLTLETWPALEALFREGGDPRSCWCQYWRLRSKAFGAAKVPELRAQLRSQAEGVRPPGLVAFKSGAPDMTHSADAQAVGWVSVGPRADFERIVRSRVIPKIDDRPVWSIACFVVSSSARGQGVARALLEGAIDFARKRGAEALEAYPVIVRAGEGIHAESAFTGTLPMFERAGFNVVAERASDPSASHQRVVVRRALRQAQVLLSGRPVRAVTGR